jgi:hypothetical protein
VGSFLLVLTSVLCRSSYEVGSSPCFPVVHDPITPHRKVTCTIPSGTALNLPVGMVQGGGISFGQTGLSYVQCQVRLFFFSFEQPCFAVCELMWALAFFFWLCSGHVDASQFGYYASGLDCLPCGLGESSVVLEAQSCSPCLPGTASGPAPSSSCVQCPAGQYSSAGASACTNCTIGRAVGVIAQAECPLCSQGLDPLFLCGMCLCVDVRAM